MSWNYFCGCSSNENFRRRVKERTENLSLQLFTEHGPLLTCWMPRCCLTFRCWVFGPFIHSKLWEEFRKLARSRDDEEREKNVKMLFSSAPEQFRANEDKLLLLFVPLRWLMLLEVPFTCPYVIWIFLEHNSILKRMRTSETPKGGKTFLIPYGNCKSFS